MPFNIGIDGLPMKSEAEVKRNAALIEAAAKKAKPVKKTKKK